MDKRARAMLILALLNEAYSDLRRIIGYVEDFIGSHPEMEREIDEYGVREFLKSAGELERKLEEVMDRVKKVVYGAKNSF